MKQGTHEKNALMEAEVAFYLNAKTIVKNNCYGFFFSIL